MTAPNGLGWWVAFESAIDDGPKTADLAKAVDVCRRTGATWVVLRCGDGGHADASLSLESLQDFAAAGIGVYLWPFVYAGSQGGLLGILRKWYATGLVRGVFLDAEFDFLKATPDEARALVKAVRDIGYDFVAHAPPDYAGGRGDGPLVALDECCDAIAPQIYAWEHNDLGHVHHLTAVLKLYVARGYGLAKVWPILCSYRPFTRGYDAQKKPIPLAALPNEPAVVAADLVAGLDAIGDMCPAPSIYSIDAMHFAARHGVADAVIAALTERAQRGGRTDPAPPPAHDPGTIPGEWHVETGETALASLYEAMADSEPTAPATPTSKSDPHFRAVKP